MTAFVTSCSVARLESDLLRPKTRLWKTGSVDNDCGNAIRNSKAAAALGWTESRACVVSCHVSAQSANLKSYSSNVVSAKFYKCLEILKCIEEIGFSGNSIASYGSLPPTYEESVSDVPPDYSCTDTLASSRFEPQHNIAPPDYSPCDLHGSDNQPFEDPLRKIAIDFSSTYNVRQHAGGKKKKGGGGGGGGKAAKNNSGNNKESPDAGGGEGSGMGDGSGGGGSERGGNQGNGGNGDKDKKGWNADDDEDEDEKKRKEAEAQSAEPDGGAGDQPVEDHFDFQPAVKKKKGKKGKDAILPPSPPPPPHPATEEQFNFEEIQLNETPKLDLTLNFDESSTKSGTLGFGTWGSSWSTGKWDFGGVTDGNGAKAGDDNPWDLGNGKKNKKGGSSYGFAFGNTAEDGQPQDVDDAGGKTDSAWMAPSSKKDKKKAKRAAFAVEDSPELKEEEPLTELKSTQAEDEWSSWGGNSGKGKKNKKSALAEKKDEVVSLLVPDKTSIVAADGDWNDGKKDKKSKGKGGLREKEVITPKDEEDHQVELESTAADGASLTGWAASKGGKKNKKKGLAVEERSITTLGSQDPVKEPEPESTVTEEISWPSWVTTPKDKNNKKKTPGVKEKEKPATQVEEEDGQTWMPELQSAADEDTSWVPWGAKRDKKTKKDPVEGKEDHPSTSLEEKRELEPEAAAAEGNSWKTWETTSKKDKKNKKEGVVDVTNSALVEERRQSIVEPEPQPTEDTLSTWKASSSKRDKKNKKGESVEDKKSEGIEKTRESIAEPETAATQDIGWSTYSTSISKKDKKGKKSGIVEDRKTGAMEMKRESIEEPGPVVTEDASWSALDTSSSKKDKKGKRSGTEDEKPGAVEGKRESIAEPEPVVTEDAGWSALGTSFSKKGKKGKRSGAEDKKPEVVGGKRESIAEPEPVVTEDASWSALGTSLSKKDKKGKKGVEEKKGSPVPKEENTETLLGLDLELATDDNNWSWPNSTSKKKGKKGIIVEAKPDPMAEVVPDTETVTSTAAEAVSTIADSSWDIGKRTKAGKKGKKAVEPPPPSVALVPAVPPIPKGIKETQGSGFDNDWSWSAGKPKKGRKNDVFDVAPDDLVEGDVMAPHAIDEPKVDTADDDWKRGLTGKKKNAKKAVVEVVGDTPADSQPDDIVEPKAETVQDSWTPSPWGTTSGRDKKKGKKGSNAPDAPPPAPTPPAQDITPSPPPPVPTIPTVPEVLAEDDWDYCTPPKAKGRKGSKKTAPGKVEETPKTGAKGSKSDPAGNTPLIEEPKQDEPHILDEPLDKPKKETAAKATKGIWGTSFGSTATKASSKTKPKDKGPEPDRESEPMQEDATEAPAKSSKSKLRNGASSASVLSKVESSKSSKISKKGNVLGKFAAVEAPIDKIVEPPEAIIMEPEETKEPENDVWSFWGASKKPTNKKAIEVKREPFEFLMAPIDPALAESVAESDVTPPPPVKVTNKSKNGLKTQKTQAAVPEPSPVPVPEPPKAAPLPKRATTKSKISNRKEVVKEAFVEANPEPDLASESISIPGSFPSETANDDYNFVMAGAAPAALGKKKAKKGKKGIVDVDTEREVNREPDPELKPKVVKAQPPPAPPEPLPPVPSAAEPEVPKPKQRARIIRDNNDMSWGFWGVPNKKKDTKPKEVAPTTEPSESSHQKVKNAAPVLARTKSTKKPTENEVEKSSTKSSSSDKASQPETRPSTSEKPGRPSHARKMSFLELLSAPPPSKSKTPRRSSATNAGPQRQPMLVEPPFPTPPLEIVSDVPEMSTKAAKILGTAPQKEVALARKESKRRKDKPPGISTNIFARPVRKSSLMQAVVENIRPPTDDDMVIVDPIVTEQVIDVPQRKGPPSKGVRDSKVMRTREVRYSPNVNQSLAAEAVNINHRNR
ncbi:MAG: hypothetical protein M1839_004687 [Geoglossum umbratile]|nr:MAG: hypothetical protein M1839_004687 [Geoglossum umbratile]